MLVEHSKNSQITRLRLVIYEFFTYSTNIPRGLHYTLQITLNETALKLVVTSLSWDDTTLGWGETT